MERDHRVVAADDHPGRQLLGRVNSVYRFFAWGMIPIGAAFGGVLVWLIERQLGADPRFAVDVVRRGCSWARILALRSTWFAAAAVYAGLFVFGRAKLTTAKIEAARTAAIANAS